MADSAEIPLLYVPGNNDSWGGNYDAFTVQGNTPFSNDSAGRHRWPMINSSAHPSESVPSIADSSQLKIGCYSAYPTGRKTKLRIIVLNTVIFVNKTQNYSASADNDSRSAITWLQRELRAVDSLKEYSLIVMHVPPGKDAYRENIGKDSWDVNLLYNNATTIQDAFLDLAVKYQNRIIGFLSSHTHLDGIKILTNRCKKFSNFFVSIPSVAPDHFNNPGLKIINYDPLQNFRLMNFTTYYNPLNESGPINWDSSYTFNNLFRCGPAVSIQDCLRRKFLQTKTTTLKQDLQAMYTVRSSKVKKEDYDIEKLLMINYQRKQCSSNKR